MAVRTQAELTNDINTKLASGSNITAAEHREVEQDIVDTMFSGNARPYKVYVALLTQTGTDAPVATELENTLGGEIVWTREDAGIYVGTLASAFTEFKTWGFGGNSKFGAGDPDILFRDIYRTDVNTIGIKTGGIDDVLLGYPIEIRVYP